MYSLIKNTKILWLNSIILKPSTQYTDIFSLYIAYMKYIYTIIIRKFSIINIEIWTSDQNHTQGGLTWLSRWKYLRRC